MTSEKISCNNSNRSWDSLSICTQLQEILSLVTQVDHALTCFVFKEIALKSHQFSECMAVPFQ